METLSDYMLLEIFALLDLESLKNCTEVCKRWNNLISRSASTMDKLTLKVDNSCKLRDLRHINRRYFSLKLGEMTISPQTWYLLSNCQQNLRKLELTQISITESNYKKVLQSIPTLEELKILDCSITSRNGRGVETVKMPMLQKLTIRDSDPFIRNIDGSALKTLEYFNSTMIARVTPLGFTCSLQNLEDLSLTLFEEYFNWCDKIPLSIPLKILKIGFWWHWWQDSVRPASSLVKAHASTLDTLELYACSYPERVSDYDLTNVLPFNSLSTTSFDEFFDRLVDVYSTNYSPELIASTAKYYMPQLKSMKIFRPQTRRRHV